jgi:hypothetical protein
MPNASVRGKYTVLKAARALERPPMEEGKIAIKSPR